MQVKTFEAMSMKDAVKAVKTEFGQGAVILRTKEKMVENNRVYEVTAAVPERSKSFGASANEEQQPAFSELDERIEKLEARFSGYVDVVARKSQIAALESGIEELKLLVMEALRQKDGSLLKDLPLALVDIHKQLQIMGVDETQTALLLKYLQELPEPQTQEKKSVESASDYYRSQAIRWMLKRINIAPRVQPQKGSLQIQAFVGPSGSGKTSTVAKIAAQYARQNKTKVLLVSFDNQRLGGSEQLRIYSKVLNTPFESIDHPNELEAIINKHRDAEVILIDTAGRSPKSQSKVTDLLELSKLPLPVEFNLVLSCTEKSTQLDRSVRSFSALSIASLSFTKLDESWSYGEIFNLSSKWSLPISHFTTGQRIPEDIERATKERVVERIFSL